MPKREINSTFGILGMNRTGIDYQLDEKQYTFMLNGNLETDEEGGISLTNEHSNFLCTQFKEGYKVIGQKYDSVTEGSFLFLTNPDTGKSEIGFLKGTQKFIDITDDIINCKDCKKKGVLSEEQITQSGCEYTVLVADDCNGCLNFDIMHPIHKVLYKNEKGRKTLYWTDGKNPLRYLVVDDLDRYFNNAIEDCGSYYCADDPDKTPVGSPEDCNTCLDCNKLLVMRPAKKPRIIPQKLQFGGNLRRGNYEFQIAYCDKYGNELSNYMSKTSPVTIFDKNSYILEQPNLADATNYGIILHIEDLDENFEYYKIVVTQVTDIQGINSQYIEGIHNISDTTVLYTTDLNKQPITYQEIYATKPYYKTVQGISEINSYLFAYGFTEETPWNLQPIVNLMGGFLRWITLEASEDLYEDPVANSLYGQYMRDEVYPFGIRFGNDESYVTPLFPLVPPPPTMDDLEPVNSSDTNLRSIIEYSPKCSVDNRFMRWQYFNTASEDDTELCTTDDDSNYTTVVITDEKYCQVKVDVGDGTKTDIVDVIPGQSFSLPIDGTEFPGIKRWYKENKERLDCCCNTGTGCGDPCPTGGYPALLCNMVNETYPGLGCTDIADPFGNDDNYCTGCSEDDLDPNQCLPPVKIADDVYIKSVENESYTLIEKVFPGEYPPLDPPSKCSVYITGGDDDEGEVFKDGRLIEKMWSYDNNPFNIHLREVIYQRMEQNSNTDVSAADTVMYEDLGVLPYHFNNSWKEASDNDTPAAMIAEAVLLTDIPADPTVSDVRTTYQNLRNHTYFPPEISYGGLWFKIGKTDLESTEDGFDPMGIFEISKQSSYYPYPERTWINYGGTETENNIKYRYHIFAGAPTAATASGLLLESGFLYFNTPFQKVITESYFDTNNTTEVYIVIEPPYRIVERNDDTDRKILITNLPNRGCFNVMLRRREFKRADITFDKINMSKRELYEFTCRYKVPNPDGCNPIPHKKGKFAYWESTEEYPDNKELYDSSWLYVDSTKIPLKYQQEFEDYYTVSGTIYDGDTNYVLNDETDLTKQRVVQWDQRVQDYYDKTCHKPIRHYKFPDNRVAPFIYSNLHPTRANTYVYPIGVTMDADIINAFLDIAVDNELITQEQRDSITYFEIFRGDRSVQRSVLFKGIANDMYKYRELGEQWMFRNFPFNTLGDNHLLNTTKYGGTFISHPYDSEGNSDFTITAPEVYFEKPKGATEVVMEGYELGHSSGRFYDVDEHPGWVILGKKAKALASELATLEVAFEAAIGAAEAFQSATPMTKGTSFTYMDGLTMGGMFALAGLNVASGLIFNYAEYRYRWLDIFKNNGSPRNYASYHVSDGKYNFFWKNTEDDNYIRGLSSKAYIKPGRPIITSEKGQKVTKINNVDRETSMYIGLGKPVYNFNYDTKYKEWDNYDIAPQNSSRYILSDAGCGAGNSNRKIGSPYMSIKSYTPAQYGTIDSITWIPINHDGKLRYDKVTDCNPIFGGDTKISRVAFKNKFKLFEVDAMGVGDRNSFDYFKYPNVPYPRFYASYDTPVGVIFSTKQMPALDSSYVMNCPSEEVRSTSDFYLGADHRFYLYYYGVPYFFIESTINAEFRYSSPLPKDQFYPNVDLEDWTQQAKIPIQYDNNFEYNYNYSRSTNIVYYNILPNYYNKKEWDKMYNDTNGVIWTQQDNTEDSVLDPWLVFKPADRYSFRTDYGKLVDMNSIESTQVVGRFENEMVVFNAVDSLADRITPNNFFMGTGGIFATRPLEFTKSDLGETGSQHKSFVSTEYGHYFTDAKRGKVLEIALGAKGLRDITANKRDGSPMFMEQWFKRHLPMKILKYGIKGLDSNSNILDNHYNSLGLFLWWDSKFKRLFLTKKDYIPKDSCIQYSDDIGFFINRTECSQEQATPQCPVGYTYNPTTGDCERTFDRPPCEQGTFNPSTGLCEVLFQKDPQITQDYTVTISCDSGFTYNPTTDMCEKQELYDGDCPQGYTLNPMTGDCERILITNLLCEGGDCELDGTNCDCTEYEIPEYDDAEPPNPTCPGGYDFDAETGLCIKVTTTPASCQSGYDYNPSSGKCEKVVTMPVICEFADTPDQFGSKKCARIVKQTPTKTYTPNGETYGCPAGYDYNPLSGKCEKLNTFSPCGTDEICIGVERIPAEQKPVIEVVHVTQPEYFEDVSFTLAYSTRYDGWVSYYSFHPDYAISYNDYFQTGLNFTDKTGVYSHLLTNKSFQMFYGDKYAWEIEVPFKNKYANKVLEAVTFAVGTYRYHNQYDTAERRKESFNKAVVYNNTNNSGYLNLEYNDNVVDTQYPKSINSITQAIKATHHKGAIGFNYFYNRVVDQDNNVPVWNWDANEIHKTINSAAVRMGGKSVLERMRGTMFFVRLAQDKHTQYKQVFKWGMSKEKQEVI